MHNLKDLRKNLEAQKKKFKERNVKFDVDDFNKKYALNKDLIIKKEKLEQEKKILSKSKDQNMAISTGFFIVLAKDAIRRPHDGTKVVRPFKAGAASQASRYRPCHTAR